MEYKNLDFTCWNTNHNGEYKCIVTSFKNNLHFEFNFYDTQVYDDYNDASFEDDVENYTEAFEYLFENFENNLARFLEENR